MDKKNLIIKLFKSLRGENLSEFKFKFEGKILQIPKNNKVAIIINIKFMVLDKLLLFFQIVLYFTSIGLSFIKLPSVGLLIAQIVIIACSIIIKILRQIKNKQIKSLLISQLNYYIGYFLLGIQAVFFYELSFKQLSDNLLLTIIIISNVNYSFFVHYEVLNLFEAICYSIGLMANICSQVSLTIKIVKFFDIVYDD